jgi:protein-L-isoaspartate(D-aspartate) O-methyltransferase
VVFEVSLAIMTDFVRARTNMVESQLRPNRVNDPVVLDAFRAVPREDFVPAALRAAAYADEDLPVGRGRYLVEPRVIARLIQEAGINPDDRILVVGSPGGYTAAVGARLGRSVVALESDPDFAARSRKALAGLANVTVVEGSLPAGAPGEGPFDVILVDGALPDLPAALLGQLAEGGRLLAVIEREGGGFGEAVIVERIAGTESRRSLFDAAVPALPGFAAAPAFAF